jgi:hypothetical protein
MRASTPSVFTEHGSRFKRHGSSKVVTDQQWQPWDATETESSPSCAEISRQEPALFAFMAMKRLRSR